MDQKPFASEAKGHKFESCRAHHLTSENPNKSEVSEETLPEVTDCQERQKANELGQNSDKPSGCEKVSPTVANIITDQARQIEELRQALTDIANLCWDAKRHIRNMYALLAEDDIDDISRICAKSLDVAKKKKAPDERGLEG